MNILALDMATKTGWAHSCGASGVWDLSIRTDESSGMRLIRFEGKIREVVIDVGVDLIVFESVTAGGGAKASFPAIKLGTKLQAIIERLSVTTEGIEHRGYAISTIKKHATGKGTANKEAMLNAARDKWTDVEIVDDNQADALWLLDLAMTELRVAPPNTAKRSP